MFYDEHHVNILSTANFSFSLLSIRGKKGKTKWEEKQILQVLSRSGKAFSPSEEKRGWDEGYLMSNFLSYIEFYYITALLLRNTHTYRREQRRCE